MELFRPVLAAANSADPGVGGTIDVTVPTGNTIPAYGPGDFIVGAIVNGIVGAGAPNAVTVTVNQSHGVISGDGTQNFAQCATVRHNTNGPHQAHRMYSQDAAILVAEGQTFQARFVFDSWLSNGVRLRREAGGTGFVGAINIGAILFVANPARFPATVFTFDNRAANAPIATAHPANVVFAYSAGGSVPENEVVRNHHRMMRGVALDDGTQISCNLSHRYRPGGLQLTNNSHFRSTSSILRQVNVNPVLGLQGGAQAGNFTPTGFDMLQVSGGGVFGFGIALSVPTEYQRTLRTFTQPAAASGSDTSLHNGYRPQFALLEVWGNQDADVLLSSSSPDSGDCWGGTYGIINDSRTVSNLQGTAGNTLNTIAYQAIASTPVFMLAPAGASRVASAAATGLLSNTGYTLDWNAGNTPLPRVAWMFDIEHEKSQASGFVRSAGSAEGQIVFILPATNGVRTSGSAQGQVIVGAAPEATGSVRSSGHAIGRALVSGTAAGDVATSSSALGALTVEGNAAGAVGTSGSALAAISITGSASGASRTSGSAIGAVTIPGQASSPVRSSGSAVGAVRVQGQATGQVRTAGVGLPAIAVPGEATGSVRTSGSALAGINAPGEGTGAVRTAGNATARVLVQGSAFGPVRTSGSALASITVQGQATGHVRLTGMATSMPLVSGQARDGVRTAGSAIGAVLVAGQATGHVRTQGCAATMLQIAGTGASVVRTSGSAVAGILVSGQTGAGPVRTAGTAETMLRVAGTGHSGVRTSGAAIAAVRVLGAAAGHVRTRGAALPMIAVPGSAAGAVRSSGAALAGILVPGIATGHVRTSGRAGALQVVPGTTAGHVRTLGFAIGTSFPTAVGANGVRTLGSALGAVTVAGAASGAVRAFGAAIARVILEAGQASSGVRSGGSAFGTLMVSGAAGSGASTSGSAQGRALVAGVAAGVLRSSGSAEGEILEVAIAAGVVRTSGSAFGVVFVTAFGTGGQVRSAGSAQAEAVTPSLSHSWVRTSGSAKGNLTCPKIIVPKPQDPVFRPIAGDVIDVFQRATTFVRGTGGQHDLSTGIVDNSGNPNWTLITSPILSLIERRRSDDLVEVGSGIVWLDIERATAAGYVPIEGDLAQVGTVTWFVESVETFHGGNQKAAYRLILSGGEIEATTVITTELDQTFFDLATELVEGEFPSDWKARVWTEARHKIRRGVVDYCYEDKCLIATPPVPLEENFRASDLVQTRRMETFVNTEQIEALDTPFVPHRGQIWIYCGENEEQPQEEFVVDAVEAYSAGTKNVCYRLEVVG